MVDFRVRSPCLRRAVKSVSGNCGSTSDAPRVGGPSRVRLVFLVTENRRPFRSRVDRANPTSCPMNVPDGQVGSSPGKPGVVAGGLADAPAGTGHLVCLREQSTVIRCGGSRPADGRSVIREPSVRQLSRESRTEVRSFAGRRRMRVCSCARVWSGACVWSSTRRRRIIQSVDISEGNYRNVTFEAILRFAGPCLTSADVGRRSVTVLQSDRSPWRLAANGNRGGS